MSPQPGRWLPTHAPMKIQESVHITVTPLLLVHKWKRVQCKVYVYTNSLECKVHACVKK